MRFSEGEPVPAIISSGIALGGKLVTNKDIDRFLGRKIGLTDKLMGRGIGVTQRFWVEEGQAASDLGAAALREAIWNAGIRPADIEGLYVGSSSPDRLGGSTVADIQFRVGLRNRLEGGNYGNACSAFIFAFKGALSELTGPLIKFGPKGYCAVMGVEVMSPVVGRDNGFSHPKRRKDIISVLVGDGAGAVIIEKVIPDKGAPTNMSIITGQDGEYADELGVEAGGSRLPTSLQTVQQGRHFLQMDGDVVYEQAGRRMVESTRDALDDAGISINDIDHFVPHQANGLMIDAVAKRLGIGMEKVRKTIGEYANTSSSSIPMALDWWIRAGVIRRNQIVVICSAGQGLSYGAAVLPMVGLPA